VQVCVSQDGLTYYTVAQSQPTYDFTRTEATRFPVSLNFKETTAKFLRLMILGGGNCPKGYYKEGTPSELALDEIEIY
jgi:hexosaminidase